MKWCVALLSRSYTTVSAFSSLNDVYYGDHDQWDGDQHGLLFLTFYGVIAMAIYSLCYVA